MAGYIEVQGHPTWVDDAGGDKPALLMLHGGLGCSETSWGQIRFGSMIPPGPSLAERLADRYRTVVFDRRGHGHTADTGERFHYASMAEETAAVIEALDLAPVNVVGYSDGGNVLLYLALSRPELIAAMVLMSANYHYEALHAEVWAGLHELAATDSYFARLYGERSPDGAEHWPVVATKGSQLIADEPTFSPDELATIPTPTLVIAADNDMFPVAHTVSLFEALPNAQLAILPNASHGHAFEQPALVAQHITAFFDHPHRRSTLDAIRRPPTSPDPP